MSRKMSASQFWIPLTQNRRSLDLERREIETQLETKHTRRRILLTTLICLVVFSIVILDYFYNSNKDTTNVRSFWEETANSAAPDKSEPITSDATLSSMMNYDAGAPYILSGTSVLKYEQGRIREYWEIPIDVQQYKFMNLYQGTVVYQNRTVGIVKAFYLPERTEIPISQGPFDSHVMGINANGDVVISMNSDAALTSKIVAINKDGDFVWRFSGVCTSLVNKYPQLVGFVACQNYQTIRQEGGWILDALTGESSRPPLRPGERVVAIDGLIYIVSKDNQSLVSTTFGGRFGNDISIKSAVSEVFFGKTQSWFRYQFQTYSLLDFINAGVVIDDLEGKVLLGNGIIVDRIEGARCSTPLLIDDGNQYICGNSSDFSKASSFSHGMDIYTRNNKLLFHIDGAVSLIRFNDQLLIVAKGSTGLTSLYLMGEKSGGSVD